MATLCFLTRDLRNDYPRIGWLPQLPDGADQLWKQFSSKGWEEAEYPETVLRQNGGQWQLFLSAIDSGRQDSADGRGRVIRMTLYLTGTTAEGEAMAGLVSHFLKEVVVKDGTALKELFLSRISNNDPTAWRDEGAVKQEVVAAELLAALQAMPPCLTAANSPAAWSGGSDNNLPVFYGVCHDLLTGKRDGMAISLTNLLECEVAKAMAACRPYGNTVILLTGMGETSLPLKEFRPPPRVMANPTSPARRTGGGAGGINSQRMIKPMVLAVVCLLSVIFIWRGCSSAKPQKGNGDVVATSEKVNGSIMPPKKSGDVVVTSQKVNGSVMSPNGTIFPKGTVPKEGSGDIVLMCFLSRDLQKNAPRSGWMPNLPAGAESLWYQFTSRGWEQSDYPEIVLSQNGGQWQLFLSAIDSGRSDAQDGRGRVALYLTGSVLEGDTLKGVVGHFLKEVVSGNGTDLKELFLSKIADDSPTSWQNISDDKQSAIAADLLVALRALPPCLEPTNSPVAWYGGSKSCLAAFHGVCLDLLTGKREGIALSLTNLLECDIAEVMTACQRYGNCVALLTRKNEDELPMKEIRLPTVEVAPKMYAPRADGGAGR